MDKLNDEYISDDSLIKENSEIPDKQESDHNKLTLKSLSDFIKLNSNKEFKSIFDQFQDIFSSIALGDFSKRIKLSNTKNLFTYFSSSLNSVMEELEVNVVKSHYLETSIEFIPHLAFITDKEGKIIFINSKVTESLNTVKETILNKSIFSLLSKLDINNTELSSTRSEPATINYNGNIIRVILSVKEIRNKVGELDGCIYIAQEMLNGFYKIQQLNGRFLVR